MEIATNAVLAAVLIELSAVVEPLGLPLETPLETAKVLQFHTGPDSAGSDRLSSILRYEGDFLFGHTWGILQKFESPNAYTTLQDPREMDRLVGAVRYSEAECLAKFKDVMKALGHTNLTILDSPPRVRGPVRFEGKVIPRYVFEWPDPKGRMPDWMSVVRVEVNAEELKVEYLWLLAQDFHREGWPLTFGQTNPPAPPEPLPKVVRTELEVQDVSREYAVALIRHILPEIEEFGRRFGPPLDGPVREEDVIMGKSSVGIPYGRLHASLRLKSGYQVSHWAGRVMTVHTPDIISLPGLWQPEPSNDPQENHDPIQFTAEEAVEKVRRLVLDQFGLPARPFYLDTSPTFQFVPDPEARSGARRYVFYWTKSETEQERNERIERRILQEISVFAEVDAVSGVIKRLSIVHPSLHGPDPDVGVPMNPPGK